jgi:peptidoglycan/LPS O-acetylase OafA/YrhL
VTGPKAKRPARSRLAILAAFALGIPVIVVIANVWSRTLWPILPILIGGWVVAMLVIRSVLTYRIISLAGLRKQREIARQEIGRLEARIDEAQRKPRDKN